MINKFYFVFGFKAIGNVCLFCTGASELLFQASVTSSWKPVATHLPLLYVSFQALAWSVVAMGNCPTAALFFCPLLGFWWGGEGQAAGMLQGVGTTLAEPLKAGSDQGALLL